MSDISITITSDPSQAIQGIKQVQKAGDELAQTSKQVSQAATGDATAAVNQVLSVGRTARREFEQTGTAVNAIGTGIKTAANEAAKVSDALGNAVPVVGKLGSAIASAITGPVGAITAAIGLAISGITKMIADVESRVQRLRASAGVQSSSAYDALMQGRADYASQLQTLAQVKEINKLAKESALTANELAAFRGLAAQIGIAESDVTARGIKSGRLGAAERTLNQQRRFYSDQEYQDYLDSFSAQLRMAIGDSGLSAATKNSLASKSVQELADTITSRARSGSGYSLDEFKAYQDLYGMVKQFNEVRASFNRDALLGRDQAALNSASVESIRARYAASARGAAESSSGGTASPGTLAAAREQDRRDQAGKKLTDAIEQEIEYQKLINDGKAREADILRQRVALESTLGRQLTNAEAASIEHLAGTLYDLRHPQEPDLAPDPGAIESPARARTRAAVNSIPLDRLQRIGANTTRAATSPEKMVMDKQLTVQEQIRNILAGSLENINTPAESVMRF